MQIKIEQDTNFKEKVPYKAVHGKFPYKLYLEIKGNCNYGRYIVIVGNKQLTDVDQIAIKVPVDEKTNGIFTKDRFLNFRVKEIDIFALGDKPMYVFKLLEK